MVNVAGLASGNVETREGGSTIDTFARQIYGGEIELATDINLGLIVCNNSIERVPGFYARIEKIERDFGITIPVVTINSTKYPKGKQPRGQTLEEAEVLCKTLEEYDIDFVTAQGYMKMGTGQFAEEWLWRPEYATEQPATRGLYHAKAKASNNHPAWLSDDPAVEDTADTHGDGGSIKAIEMGLPINAFSLQLMAAGIDQGPIIFQYPLRIRPGETADELFGRIQKKEKEYTALMLSAHLANRAVHLATAS